MGSGFVSVFSKARYFHFTTFLHAHTHTHTHTKHYHRRARARTYTRFSLAFFYLPLSRSPHCSRHQSLVFFMIFALFVFSCFVPARLSLSLSQSISLSTAPADCEPLDHSFD